MPNRQQIDDGTTQEGATHGGKAFEIGDEANR